MTAQPVPSLAKLTPQSGRVQLRCDWERPSVCAKEVLSLAERWRAEIGSEPFDPDWGRLFAMERASQCAVWTARTLTGPLVGYMVCTFTRGLFINRQFARIQAGYLAPEWRPGLRYIKSTLDAIKRLGDFTIEWETNDHFEPDADGRSRLALLLQRLGFEQVGTVMSRK
jgi:hypothetical protein